MIQNDCVISIYIYRQGSIPQGKYCEIDHKPCFIANMTPAKWWRNYSGYSVSKRILDTLPKGTKILLKREDLNQYYEATKTAFYNRGILINYGGHQQIVLPIKNFKVHQGAIKDEPKNLPVIDLEQWGRDSTSIHGQDLRTQPKVERPHKFDLYDLKREWERIRKVENRQAIEPSVSSAY